MPWKAALKKLYGNQATQNKRLSECHRRSDLCIPGFGDPCRFHKTCNAVATAHTQDVTPWRLESRDLFPEPVCTAFDLHSGRSQAPETYQALDAACFRLCAARALHGRHWVTSLRCTNALRPYKGGVKETVEEVMQVYTIQGLGL